MNVNFGKVNNGTIEYAPSILSSPSSVVVNPSAEQYLAFGWKRIDGRTPPNDGHVYTRDGFDEDDTQITIRWKEVQQTIAETIVIDKVKLIGVCAGMQLWAPLKAWMQESMVNLGGVEVPVYDAFMAAGEDRMVVGTDLFDAWFREAKAALGVTDEVGEVILAQSRKEA